MRDLYRQTFPRGLWWHPASVSGFVGAALIFPAFALAACFPLYAPLVVVGVTIGGALIANPLARIHNARLGLGLPAFGMGAIGKVLNRWLA